MLNDLYFKTTYNITPHFLGPTGGLKIEGLLYFRITQDYLTVPVDNLTESTVPVAVHSNTYHFITKDSFFSMVTSISLLLCLFFSYV